ncbi:hypothetical protein D3C81_1220420 [compost metagenome]
MRTQRLAVDLAIAQAWHPFQHMDSVWHHRRRQAQPQFGLEVTQCRPRHRHHERQQCFAIAQPHHRFADAWQLQQLGCDFGQFNAEATNLHLLITPALQANAAMHLVTGQVARAVQALARLERVVDHGLRGAIEVTPAQLPATNVQLAQLARRDQVQLCIEHVDLVARQYLGQRHAGLFTRRCIQGMHHDPHGGFGWPVMVEHTALAVDLADTLQQCWRWRLAAKHQGGR